MIGAMNLCRLLLYRRRFRSWTTAQIQRWQIQQARRQVRRAAGCLPYYRELWHGHDLNDVWNLPTTRKRDLMQHIAGANILSVGWDELANFREQIDASGDYGCLFRDHYNVELSSGTSGAKGIFLFSPAERSLYGTMIAARLQLPRALYPLRAVLILRVDSPSFQAINRRSINLKYLSLSTPVPVMVGFLNEAKPNLLAGQPWVLRELAREQRAGRLRSRLGALVPVAEVLEPDVREEISRDFAAPIRELYQASEGFIASSCTWGRLHINEDFVAVQLYDNDGGPAQPGSLARRMVVTDLYRRTQPIIRYELNDMIELDPDLCPCGSRFRVIRRIHGRADDLLWAEDRAGKPRPIFPDYFLRYIIRATEAVEEYQVTQTDRNCLLVRLQVRSGQNADAAAAVRASLGRLYAEHGCVPPEIEFSFGPPRLHAESLKLRRVIRAFAEPSPMAPPRTSEGIA
jgi:putative adenylate-forming enzyme